MASFGPFSAIYFSVYEYFKKKTVLQNKEIGLYESIFCAGIAGSIASYITNPLDIAKVRMQVVRATRNCEVSIFPYRNMMHGIFLIYKLEGVKALFQGSLSRILFHAPNTAISMALVKYVRSFLYHNLE